MPILERLEDFTSPRQPLVLTIGNFDGMHRGHCALLKHAQTLAKEGELLALTFRNHPSQVLKPHQPTSLLITLSHKLHLLQQFGVDRILLLPFTHSLSQSSAKSFIKNVRECIPFSHLVLGHDARLGHNREGDPLTIKAISKKWDFDIHYFKEHRHEGEIVSSTRIRDALQRGDLIDVEKLLGRSYSIYGPVIPGQGKGKKLGFPTANLRVLGLSLPPFGVYAVEIIHDLRRVSGIANLGVAPTLRKDDEPILEVHLFESNQDWVGSHLEVVFKQFIRSEQKFYDLNQLQKQIHRDILFVRNLLDFK